MLAGFAILDSFEAVLTTSGFYNFRHHTPQISEWYRGYVKSFVGFVPDIGTIVVRTSVGTVVYPDADNIMRATNLVHLKETKTSKSRSNVITLEPTRITTGLGLFLIVWLIAFNIQSCGVSMCKV